MKKNKIVIIADRDSRGDPSGPLFRFIRDYAGVLRRFEIHSTHQTGRSILATGLYHADEIILPDKWDGVEPAQVVELIARVARGECVAAIFFSNPMHSPVDSVEYRTLKRVCIESQVRWLSSLENAEDWAISEAKQLSGITDLEPKHIFPSQWRSGKKNVEDGTHAYLQIGERTIALIAHDKKKKEILEFVKNHMEEVLIKFDRILATGTTGWLLKLMYADKSHGREFASEMDMALASDGKSGGAERMISVVQELLGISDNQRGSGISLDSLLNRLKNDLQISANQTFAEKILPLASGPKGGDVLIAHEVLKHECHAIVFFHDPDTAHPHESDIELLERTCRLDGVHAVCVSDKQSADRWAQGIQNELQSGRKPSLASQLRSKWRDHGLREVIIVEVDNDETPDAVGNALARASAGYLHQRLLHLLQQKNLIRLGVSWGYVMQQVLQQLEELETSGYIQRPESSSMPIVCSPIVGILTALAREREANEIAQRLASFYRGEYEGFASSGFRRGTFDYVPSQIQRIITTLEESTDVIMTSGAPWREDASLITDTGLKSDAFPSFEEAIGTISGVFLQKDGSEARGDYEVVGLGYEGFQQAAQRGAVVLVCGAENRRALVRAALTGGLVSVLITTNRTAEALLNDG